MRIYQHFLFENFHFLVVKFSIYLNRRVFVMEWTLTESYKSSVLLFYSFVLFIKIIIPCFLQLISELSIGSAVSGPVLLVGDYSSEPQAG